VQYSTVPFGVYKYWRMRLPNLPRRMSLNIGFQRFLVRLVMRISLVPSQLEWQLFYHSLSLALLCCFHFIVWFILLSFVIFRQPDVSRNALSFTAVLILSFFSPWHRSQQSRRGRPSNVFRRFGRRWSYINRPRDLAHPSPNCHRGGGVKNCGIWRHFWHH